MESNHRTIGMVLNTQLNVIVAIAHDVYCGLSSKSTPPIRESVHPVLLLLRSEALHQVRVMGKVIGQDATKAFDIVAPVAM